MSPLSDTADVPHRPPRFAALIATGLGAGYLPKAPGTWGSLLTVVVAWVAVSFNLSSSLFVPHSETFPWVMTLFTIAVAGVGVWASGKVAVAMANADPQCVVIDEISGQQISLIPIGLFHWHPYIVNGIDPVEGLLRYLVAAFVLFRIFDIWKPWPARAAEKLPGGWGIMADDWVAGIYAAICLWGLRALGM